MLFWVPTLTVLLRSFTRLKRTLALCLNELWETYSMLNFTLTWRKIDRDINPPKTSTCSVLNGLCCVCMAFCAIKSWVSIVQMEREYQWIRAGVICECSHGRLTGFNRRLLNVRVQGYTGIKWSSSIALKWSLWLALLVKYNFLFLKVIDNEIKLLNWIKMNLMEWIRM